jgi:hypothetical protein
VAIDYRRDLAVGADSFELWRELVPFANVDRDHGEVAADLLEQDMNLVSVRRWPGIDVDHCFGLYVD